MLPTEISIQNTSLADKSLHHAGAGTLTREEGWALLETVRRDPAKLLRMPDHVWKSSTRKVTREEAIGYIMEREPGSFLTNCPLPDHQDENPSLSIKIDNGKVLTHCHGCGASHKDIMAAFGIESKAKTFAELPTGTHYFYYPDDGRRIAVVRQKENGKKKISLWRETPTGRWDPKGVSKIRAKFPLYRLAQLKDKTEVVVVEGEKCVHELLKHNKNMSATCSIMGAGKAAKTDWTPIARKKTLIVADSDDAGHKHADETAQILLSHDCEVKVYKSPVMDGKDVVDWIERDGVKNTFERIKRDAKTLQPRIPHLDIQCEELDLSIEIIGRTLGMVLKDRICYYKSDYWRAGTQAWERIPHDNQLKSEIAIEFRPKIRRELEDRSWIMKPDTDDPKYFTAYPGLWGAFDKIVTRDLTPKRGSLAVANGILTLGKDGPVLSPFDPSKHNNTTFSPISYASPEDDVSARYGQLMMAFFDLEDQQKFENLMAEVLFKGAFRKFLTLYAPPGSGKSTLVNLVDRTFGELCYSVSAEAMQQLSATSEGLVDLIQRDPAFVFINESVQGINAPLLNAWTGRDELRARRLRKQEVNGRLTGLPIIFRETPVTMYDETQGTLDRRIDIRMNGKIVNPDSGLLDRIVNGQEDELCGCLLYKIVEIAHNELTRACRRA